MVIAGGAVTLVVVGGIAYSRLDSWFSNEPTGPGSGDEVDLGNGPGEQGPGSGDELPPDEPTGPGSGDEMPTGPELAGPGSGDELDSEYFRSIANGSCNIIAGGSTCAEYIGDYYTNKDFKELNCDSVGVYSEGPCPRPIAGGCRMNADNTYEMIVWHYDYGGDPFNDEELGYAAQACGMSPMGNWIYAD